MTVMHTSVSLDSRVFWKLAGVAEAHDMRVDEYLAELAFQASLRRDSDGADSVAARWRRGWTDKQIAADLGWTNAAVASRRQRLGLQAHRKGRTA